MAEFRTKLITLAGLATMFTSMAFGQASLSPNGLVTTGAISIRAEGTAELLPSTTLTIVNPSGSSATSVTFTLYLAPSLNITSQVVSKVSEASANSVAGVVNGSTVTFTNVPILAAPANTVITIAGIRVNASSLATGSGIPQGVSEQVFLQGSTGVVTPGATTATIVAYATNGLVNTGTSAAAGAVVNNGTVCGGLTNTGFTVTFTEGFVGAFKTLAGEAGVYAAQTGTGLSLTFANVPSSTAIYLPITVTSNAGVGNLTLVASPTSPATGTNAVSASTATGVPTSGSGYGAVPVANGTATAYYQVTATNPSTVDSYTVNVFEITKAGALASPTSAITATVALAPSVAAGSAPSSYPSFVGANSAQTVNGNSYTACSTTLLFPFVTNQAGFETGIAISNTSSDLLSSKGTNSVTAQAGTCNFTFFGGTTNPPAFPTTSVAAGTTWAGTLTSVTGGTPNTFSGYMIAQCNFLYGHGFSYITYNIGQPSGMAMGYLALELVTPRPTGTSVAESLNN
jgi:hypothetical protein